MQSVQAMTISTGIPSTLTILSHRDFTILDTSSPFIAFLIMLLTEIFFHRFDVGSVLNEDLSLNESAYEQNRPLLLTPYL